MRIEALSADQDLKKASWKLNQNDHYEWVSGRALVNLFTGMTLCYGEEEISTFVVKGFEVRRKMHDWLRLGHADVVFLSKISGPDISFDKPVNLWIKAESVFRGLANAPDPENKIGAGILSYDLIAATVFALNASFQLREKGVLRITQLETLLLKKDSFPYVNQDQQDFFSTFIPYDQYDNMPGEYEVPLEKVLTTLRTFGIYLPKAEEVKDLSAIEYWIQKTPHLSPEQTKQFISQL